LVIGSRTHSRFIGFDLLADGYTWTDALGNSGWPDSLDRELARLWIPRARFTREHQIPGFGGILGSRGRNGSRSRPGMDHFTRLAPIPEQSEREDISALV
jgi:hypothetical protein